MNDHGISYLSSTSSSTSSTTSVSSTSSSSSSSGQQQQQASSEIGGDLDAAGSQDNDTSDEMQDALIKENPENEDCINNNNKNINLTKNSSRSSSSSTLTKMSTIEIKKNINKINIHSSDNNLTSNEKVSSIIVLSSTASNTTSSSSASTSSICDSEEEEEADDDGNDANCVNNMITINNVKNNDENEETRSFNDLSKSKMFEKFNEDYDAQIENIADRATSLISEGSFFNCGLYQFISFIFVSIAWTIGNGWYAYVSVFSGFTPEHECDINSMVNVTRHANDSQCYATDINTNETVKCTKWIYDSSQMISTIITEYDFVCEKNYYFEVAYTIEQFGYILGTLIFSFVADIIGRKPVLVGVLFSMAIVGLFQYFIIDFVTYMIMGFILNSLACGLEAVCVTLVLEMFSTSKRTIFGIGIEVVWVLVLASMSPMAYAIKTWREIRLVIFIVLTVLALSSYWLVEESLRWLISMSKLSNVNSIIDRIARYNMLSRKHNIKSKRYFKKRSKLARLLDELKAYNKYHANLTNTETESINILSKKFLKSNESEIEESIIKKTSSIITSPESSNSSSINKNQKSKDAQLTTSTIVNESSKNDCTNNSDESNTKPADTPFVNISKHSNNKIMDIIKNPKFRLYVLIMSMNWFATALVYDGLTYLNNFIGENIFINWIAMNIIELPAQFFCYYVISRYGRRLTISVTLIMAGVTLLATFFEIFEVIEKMTWIKFMIFILAKFIVTQSYSAVILHAPELFPTNLRSFGYGICLFSGKITSVISPLTSIYLSKIYPRLPAIIYGIISVTCGIISLYVPETLNRPLPNSIEDVVKWPRTLSDEEWRVVKEINREELSLSKFKHILKCCCNKDKNKTEKENDESDKSIKNHCSVFNKNAKIIDIVDINNSNYMLNAITSLPSSSSKNTHII